MLRKLQWESIKWQLFILIPLLVLRFIFAAINEKFYATHEGHSSYYYINWFSILSESTTVVIIVVLVASVLYTAYKYLLSNESVRYFSLPCKKSSILLSVTLPTIALVSLGYGIIYDSNLLEEFIAYCVNGIVPNLYYTEGFNLPTVVSVLIDTAIPIITYTFGLAFCLVLALMIYTISKSLNPKYFLRNFLILSAITFLIVIDIPTLWQLYLENVEPDRYSYIIYDTVIFSLFLLLTVAIPMVTKRIADKKMSIT